MGSIDNGTQKITIDYKSDGKSTNVNNIGYKVVATGIYDTPPLMVRVSDTGITVEPFTCVVEDVTAEVSVRVETTTLASVTVSSTLTMVVLRMNWLNTENNYADFEAIEPANVLDTDIVIGECNYTGTTLVDFDYSNQSVVENVKDLSTTISNNIDQGVKTTDSPTFEGLSVNNLELSTIKPLLMKTALLNGALYTSYTFSTGSLYHCTYGNGIFVGRTSDTIYTTIDGISWTSRQVLDGNILSIAYGGGIFIAITTVSVYTSPDGVNWTITTALPFGTNVEELIYGDGIFVAGTIGGSLWTSPDATIWTLRQDIGGVVTGLAYGNGVYVASEILGDVFYSSDATTWTLSQSFTYDGGKVAYGRIQDRDIFLLMIEESINKVYSSSDGVSWTEVFDDFYDSGVPKHVIFGNGVFLLSDNNGALYTSTDGTNISYTQKISEADISPRSICYGNGIFIIGVYTGEVLLPAIEEII